MRLVATAFLLTAGCGLAVADELSARQREREAIEAAQRQHREAKARAERAEREALEAKRRAEEAAGKARREAPEATPRRERERSPYIREPYRVPEPGGSRRILGEETKPHKLGEPAETVRQPIAPSVQYPFATPPLRQQAEDLERAGRNEEAIKTYIRAARSGDGKAAMRLGQIYRDGIDGIAPNRDESLKWFNAARVLGEYQQPPEPLQKPR